MEPPIANGARPTVRYGKGPRHTENLLLHDLDQIFAELGQDVLARPILLVVPSQSLRLHLLAKLARVENRSAAGLKCFTLHALAKDLVLQTGGSVPRGLDPFPLLARRLARAEPSLSTPLEPLTDGYSTILGTVRDLLDAGLESAHEEALLEVLEKEGPGAASREEIERARSLVRVAAHTAEAMETQGLSRISTVLARATECLKGGEIANFHLGGLLIYGFADATGLATDLIEALLGRFGGHIYLERPPDLADPQGPVPGEAFGRRFRERIEAVAREEEVALDSPDAAQVEMFGALGAEAEVREVARRIRRLLDQDTVPEAIGVVARSLDSHTVPLRKHFNRLAIPFSGVAASGPRTPAGRRVQALLDLFTLRGRVALDRWLESHGMPWSGVATFDLRLALFGLGAARLEEVAGLALDRLVDGDRYYLPVRRGLLEDEAATAADDDTASRQVRAKRRSIPTKALQQTVAVAKNVHDRLVGWPTSASSTKHFDLFGKLLRNDLAWQIEDELTQKVLARVDNGLRGLSADLARDEFAQVLKDSLDDEGREPLGGSGGGVQVLDVTEARARTFEHLFLFGLNRGIFPRIVRDDPLLPDPLRNLLSRHGAGVLPDLQSKRSGFEEERFLFAQLVSSAPRVTLSWQEVDEDNKLTAPSPLVERLRWSELGQSLNQWRRPFRARHPFAAPTGPVLESEGAGLLPAVESSVLMALHGTRRDLAPLLPIALEEAHQVWGGKESAALPDGLAEVRLRILDELDPIRPTTEQRAARTPGPFFGFVGPISGSQDPRDAGELYITTVESIVRCPWQSFLQRVLRLEPLPDPLEALPTVDSLLIGKLVHRVAERIVRDQLSGVRINFEEIGDLPGTAVSWPSQADLLRSLTDESESLVRDEGIGLPGFATALAAAVGPHIEVLRRADWKASGSTIEVLAAEVDGSVELNDTTGGSHRVAFRADRVDSVDGILIFTDYKTGKATNKKYLISKRPATRQKHFARGLREGKLLQAPIYSQALPNHQTRGRFLFLDPEFDDQDQSRELIVESTDSEVVQTSTTTALVAKEGWTQGTFFPRLVLADEDKEPQTCGYCSVAQACLRGDSGARARLRAWTMARQDSAPREEGDSQSQLSALLDLWFLPVKKESSS